MKLLHSFVDGRFVPGGREFADINPADGTRIATVTEAGPKRMVTRVEVGGRLSDRKGVSLPGTTVPFSALDEKDRSDLEAALNAGIDWVALSFIQRPEDIAEAVHYLASPGASYVNGEVLHVNGGWLYGR